MRLIMLTILESGYRATMALDIGIELLCKVIRSYTSNVQVRRPLGTFFSREAEPNKLFRSWGFTQYGYLYGQLRMGS